MESDVFEDVGDYEPPDVELMGSAAEITLGHRGTHMDGMLVGSL
jgi:hypothetical protein